VAVSVATRLITHRVARKACRSHVESGTNLAESATVLFTEVLWKRSGCGKGGALIPAVLVRQTKKRVARPCSAETTQAAPKTGWPCKSNSVCLGSSPRAQNRVGAFWAFDRVLAAGPVKPVYSSEPHSARFRPGSVVQQFASMNPADFAGTIEPKWLPPSRRRESNPCIADLLD
jgi:hypothetical protein